MTASTTAHTGWTADDLARLHRAGAGARTLRQLREQWPNLAAYRDGWHADRAALAARGLPDPTVDVAPLPTGVWVLTLGDPTYPPQLAAAPSPPLLLYGRGNPAALTAAVAVVGARDMTAYGQIVTDVAVRAAASVGAPVVSGLARGVDGHAASTALDVGVPTIAVIAAGVNHPTPRQHTGLAQRIVAAGGAVVSEQPPDYDPGAAPEGDRRYAQLLQARNRIIAGLAATLVPAEASLRSGTVGAVWAALAADRYVIAAPPRPAHRTLPGAQLPLLLADPKPRDENALRAVGMPASLAATCAYRSPLASAVAEGRDDLTDLVRVATMMSAWATM